MVWHFTAYFHYPFFRDGKDIVYFGFTNYELRIFLSAIKVPPSGVRGLLHQKLAADGFIGVYAQHYVREKFGTAYYLNFTARFCGD